MADLVTGARSLVHRAVYLVQGDIWVFVSLALVLAAVVQAGDIGSPWLPPLLLVLGALGTVVSVGREVALFLRKRADWEFARLSSVFPAGTSIVDDELERRMTTDLGSIFVSPALNRTLRRARTRVEMQPVGFRLGVGLRPYASTFIRATGPTSPFNGRCVRLDSDLTKGTVSSPVPARLRSARYFDALCSNQLTLWRITRNGVPWPFRDRYLFRPSPHDSAPRTLVALGASELANIIGVSTLAITADDHLVVVLQSRGSGSSAGMWAPSGSGSLEPRDVLDGASLEETVSHGAVRELREECVIREEDVRGSCLIGYGRWLEHGGKPEFITLTALSLTSEQIRHKPRWRLSEPAWTQCVKAVPLHLDRFATADDPWATRRPLVVELTSDADMDGTSSLPLEFAFRCLIDAYRHEPHILDDLRQTQTRGVAPT